MSKQEFNEFLTEIILAEEAKSILAITASNLTPLISLNEETLDNIQIVIDPEVGLINPADLCIIFEDSPITKTQLGLIKNILSQKILVIRKSHNDREHQSLIELGFMHDSELTRKQIYSYNLKTYNNKRGWNNPEGWANPENFEKFRW